MHSLDQLTHNIDLLLARLEEQQRRIAELEKENESQREDLIHSHAELAEIQRKYRYLQDAHALLGSEVTRTQARNHINYLIAQIDQALDALKS